MDSANNRGRLPTHPQGDSTSVNQTSNTSATSRQTGRLGQYTVQAQPPSNLLSTLSNFFQGVFTPTPSNAWQVVPQEAAPGRGTDEVTYADSMKAMGATMDQLHQFAGRHRNEVGIYIRLFCGQNPVIQRAADGRLNCTPAIDHIDKDLPGQLANALAAEGFHTLAAAMLTACALATSDKKQAASLVNQCMNIVGSHPRRLDANTVMALAVCIDLLAWAGTINTSDQSVWRTQLAQATSNRATALQLLPVQIPAQSLSDADLGKTVNVLREAFFDAILRGDHEEATAAYNHLCDLHTTQSHTFVVQAMADCELALAQARADEEVKVCKAALHESGFHFTVPPSTTGQYEIKASQKFDPKTHGPALLAYVRAQAHLHEGMLARVLLAWIDFLRSHTTPGQMSRTELRQIYLLYAVTSPGEASTVIQAYLEDLRNDLGTLGGGVLSARELGLLDTACKSFIAAADFPPLHQVLNFLLVNVKDDPIKHQLHEQIATLQLALLSDPALEANARSKILIRLLISDSVSCLVSREGQIQLLNAILTVSPKEDYETLAALFCDRFFSDQPTKNWARQMLDCIYKKAGHDTLSFDPPGERIAMLPVWSPLIASFIRSALAHCPSAVPILFAGPLFTPPSTKTSPEEYGQAQHRLIAQYLDLFDCIASQDVAASPRHHDDTASGQKIIELFSRYGKGAEFKLHHAIALGTCVARMHMIKVQSMESAHIAGRISLLDFAAELEPISAVDGMTEAKRCFATICFLVSLTTYFVRNGDLRNARRHASLASEQINDTLGELNDWSALGMFNAEDDLLAQATTGLGVSVASELARLEALQANAANRGPTAGNSTLKNS